jgi:hypothetical protein
LNKLSNVLGSKLKKKAIAPNTKRKDSSEKNQKKEKSKTNVQTFSLRQ